MQTVSRLHLSKPYFDPINQKWVNFCCSYYSMTEPFHRSLSINGNTYTSSAITCVLVDLTKLLDYKMAVNNTKVLIPASPNQTLQSITNSYMVAADNIDSNILFMPKSLSPNYNYTSLFAPDLVRYTGFSSSAMKQDLNNLDNRVDNKTILSYVSNLVVDPLEPSLVDLTQIHVRSMTVSERTNKNLNYIIRSLFYFNMEDLSLSKNLIISNIDAAQYQITYLALIVIIIICAVVICISFQ